MDNQTPTLTGSSRHPVSAFGQYDSRKPVPLPDHLRPLGANTVKASGSANSSDLRDLSLAPTLGLNLARTRHLLDLLYNLRIQAGAMLAQLHGVAPQTQTGRYALPDGPESEVVEQDLGLPRAQSILLDRLELHLEALRQELGQLAETF